MSIDETRLRRDRVLFYAGLVMLIGGLPGLAIGSLLHDVFRVNLVGQAYNAWGWINQLFAYLGIIITIVGAALLAVSLRGGVVDEPVRADAEGGPE